MLIQSKSFLSHSGLLESRLGVQKKLGGHVAGTEDPTWPKGYPIPYRVMLGNKSRRKKE